MPMNTANKLTLARVFLIPVFLVIAVLGLPRQPLCGPGRLHRGLPDGPAGRLHRPPL